MPANHTPTKWYADFDRVNSRYILRSETEGSFGHFSGWALDGVTTSEEDAANAAFIVRACNCHEELVQVLDSIHDLPVYDEGFRTIPPGFLDAARAVLKKARGSV